MVGIGFLGTLDVGVGVGFLSDSGSPIESFFHRTPKSGIETRTCGNGTIFLELLLLCITMSTNCWCLKNCQESTSFTFCWGVGVGNFRKVRVGVRHLTSESATLVSRCDIILIQVSK